MRRALLLLTLLTGCTPWDRTCGGPFRGLTPMCRPIVTALDDPAPCPGQSVTFSGQLGPPGAAANVFLTPYTDDQPRGARSYVGTALSDEYGTYRLTFAMPQVAGASGVIIDVEGAQTRISRNVRFREGCAP